jgi:hypothetical protein
MSLIRAAVQPDGTIVGAGPFPLGGIPAVYTFDNGAPTLATPQVVPLQQVPAQQFDITLNNQSCTIKLYFKQMWIPARQDIYTNPPVLEQVNPGFLDLYVNDVLIVGGVRCMDRNLIVRNTYLGFLGDLSFIDTQGFSDPQPSGLGTRWLLTYWNSLP